MHMFLRFLMVLILGVLMAGCGKIHNTLMVKPDSEVVVKEVTLLPVDLSTSDEQAPALLELQNELKKQAEDELQALLTSKNIAVSNKQNLTVGCHIEMAYGNRALRYFVGFGAGSGGVRVTIELKDEGGVIRYATDTKADLSVGAFGGNMKEVARKAIHAAVKEFGSRL